MAETEDDQREHARLSAAWLYTVTHPPKEYFFRSTTDWWCELPEFRKMAAIGPSILPHLAARVLDGGSAVRFEVVISEITRADRSTLRADIPCPQPTPGKDRKRELAEYEERAFRSWWYGGEAKAREMFEKRRRAWREATAHVKDKDALYRQCRALLAKDRRERTPLTGAKKAAYLRLKGMGITALPMFLEHIVKGEHELIPIVVAVTDNAAKVNDSLPPKEQAKRLRKWWVADKQKWLIPWPKKQ